MATLVAAKAQSDVSPRLIETGVISVQSEYTVGAALSVGDTIQMMKIPNHATVVDVHVAGGSGSCAVDFGDSEDDNRYLDTLSASGTLVRTESTLLSGMNYTYSASAGETGSAHFVLQFTVDVVTTGTAAGVFYAQVAYTMDK